MLQDLNVILFYIYIILYYLFLYFLLPIHNMCAHYMTLFNADLHELISFFIKCLLIFFS